MQPKSSCGIRMGRALSFLSPSIESKVREACDNHATLCKLLEDGVNEKGRPLDHSDYARLAKQTSSQSALVDAFEFYQQLCHELADLEALEKEEDDEEIQQLAREEMPSIRTNIEETGMRVLSLLAPRDTADDRNAMIEIRAGAGGDEASLFANELMQMYQQFAKNVGWRCELVSSSDSAIPGGTKEAMLSVKLPGGGASAIAPPVFGRLKHESGVHRVQRVPVNDDKMHTSAVAVVVLPEAEEEDVTLNDDDLSFDTFRSSGAGGQSVNTTDSAVRVTHKPTGIVVSMQDERSQHRNKAKAISVLRARLFDHQRAKFLEERNAMRGEAVVTADRSQRVRTYNFPERRVTDHRVGLTLNGALKSFMDGDAKALNEILDALEQQERADALKTLTGDDD